MEIHHHHSPIEHLPHLHHVNELADIDFPPSKISSTRIGVGVKLRSIETPPSKKIFENDLNFGDEPRLNSREKHHTEHQDNCLFHPVGSDSTSHQQPQPPLIGKPSKSLQAKLSKGYSFNNDGSRNDDLHNRNNLILEPIEHVSVKKVVVNDAKFEKQTSFSEKSTQHRRSNSFREMFNESPKSVKQTPSSNYAKPPRVEEEGTVLRGKLLDVQQSHQRQRKERPLYIRMISRAQRKRQDEDRKKVEEYEAFKKSKAKCVPLRSDIKEHMARYDDQKGGNGGPKYSNVKDKDLANKANPKGYSKQQRQQQLPPTNSQSLDAASGGGIAFSNVLSPSDAVPKQMKKLISVKPVKASTPFVEEYEEASLDAVEEYEDDEEDETYAIRRQDEMITIPVVNTNSIVSFCADDWVNKLLEIDSIEKTKLTEMDYLLSY
mmetsp:Transcript_29971/g.41180  ORF Transcript_29971/g.41180 Transcript_29971/m.41180 type:complete len:433 (-) Transcript_29971:267-1565(-)|eukprot:CAMPEP_0170074764 /NCGR_PEP_ID=MMETSP0019_2-20121128/12014_1 /TAXON_ID=98059 /ORGANISM="Dinobryon sp., Strain UTEXLB2267" /LENGTH=432 /DNA_ID=CAMNT_0010285285 /DNA_START=74 /DNA_END=1372 /DNA_ORIENTATION=+